MAEVTAPNNVGIETVESWLQSMGCKFSRSSTPETTWMLEVEFPTGSTHRINVFNPKNQPLAIGIVTGVQLGQEYPDAFGKLGIDAQKEFRWQLVKALSAGGVEFNLKENPAGRPLGFEIMATRYWDGLTLDSFARSVFAVYKTEIVAINCVRRYL